MHRQLRFLLLLLTPLLVGAAPGPQDGAAVAGSLAWTRSIVCPVLYTHEVPSQTMLRRFLNGLLAAGYHPATLASVDAAMSGVSEAVSGCIVLTFDDALLSQHVNAAPVLSELGVPAVFFVLPAFADGVHRYMGASELQALALAGFEVEAHTCNHPFLPRLARLNMYAFFAELQDCKHLVEGITGQAVDYVAYPYGSYDATVLDAVARVGYRAAFTTRASALLTANSPFTLPRIRYDPGDTVATVLGRIRKAGG